MQLMQQLGMAAAGRGGECAPGRVAALLPLLGVFGQLLLVQEFDELLELVEVHLPVAVDVEVVEEFASLGREDALEAAHVSERDGDLAEIEVAAVVDVVAFERLLEGLGAEGGLAGGDLEGRRLGDLGGGRLQLALQLGVVVLLLHG